jgi:hypothetical protein
VRVRRRQLENKALLEADPHSEIDTRIKATLSTKKVGEAMEALRRRVDEHSGVIDADFTEVSNPVSNARRLLDAPRFPALNRLGSPSATPIRARRS